MRLHFAFAAFMAVALTLGPARADGDSTPADTHQMEIVEAPNRGSLQVAKLDPTLGVHTALASASDPASEGRAPVAAAPEGGTVTTPPSAPAPEAPPAPSAKELLTEAKTVYDTWTVLGALAGLAALLNLLVNVLKFGPIKEWFEVNRKKWLLVYISVGLGGIAGGLGAHLAGVSVIEGVMGGLMAGAMASGSHEFFTKLRPSKQT